jgi:hypothetical protein
MWPSNAGVYPVPGAYLGRLGRKRFAVRSTTYINVFALEAAKLVLVFIAARDRLSATKTEVLLASTAREGSLALKARFRSAHSPDQTEYFQSS